MASRYSHLLVNGPSQERLAGNFGACRRGFYVVSVVLGWDCPSARWKTGVG